jgi:hypothetical protein
MNPIESVQALTDTLKFNDDVLTPTAALVIARAAAPA